MAKHKDETPAEEVVADAQETVQNAVDAVQDAVAAPEVVPEAAPVDPDLAAFEEVEREYPDLFAKQTPAQAAANVAEAEAKADTAADASDDVATKVSHALGTSDPNENHDSLAAAYAAAAEPTVDETQVLPAAAAPIAPVPSYPAPAQPVQPAPPVFVQAPEPPRIRGNRGTIALIGLLAAATFALLYFAVDWVAHLIAGTTTLSEFVDFALIRVSSIGFWMPTIVFYIGFWLLGVFINRAKWGKWVFFSFIPGLFAWGGVALGGLVANEFWKHSSEQMLSVAETAAISLAGLAAFIIGREVTVWYGKWAAHSGAKKIAEHERDEAEYERTIEAGPRL